MRDECVGLGPDRSIPDGIGLLCACPSDTQVRTGPGTDWLSAD
jgi:hypothetical protein